MLVSPEPTATALDIEFALDKTLYDGRYANNAWMQEIPDPIHKLVWDNALLLNPKTIRALGLNGHPKPGSKEVDLVKITYRERSMEVAVWEVAGVADFTGILHLGTAPI